jgi:hypothetical protein
LVVPDQPRGSGERSRTWIIIRADYHPGFQQIAFVDTDTGEFQERDCNIARKGKSFIASSRPRGWRCEWGWKPVDRRTREADKQQRSLCGLLMSP